MRPDFRLTASVLALALVTACGSAPEERRAARSAPRPAAAVVSPDANLVSAVKSTAGTLPLAIRFELLQRPVVGSEFAVRVRVESADPLEGLQVRYELTDGLVFVGPEPTLQESKVPTGARMDRNIKLRATREGFFEVRAVATAEANPGPGASATFSMPLIVDRPAAP